MWKFLVKNQSIEILEREVLADHQIQYVQFKFTFDGDWKKFHKVVQFSQCDEIYSIVLGFDGTTCYLPAELHVGAVKMSVFGYDAESDTTVRATTVPVTLNIRESGFVGDDDTPIPPTPDLYTQLLQKISEIQAGVDGKDGLSAYEIAKENGFVGTVAEWLESLKGADGLPGKDGKDGRDGADGRDGVDGITPDMSEYPTTSAVELIIQKVTNPLSLKSHEHENKTILDGTTASYTLEEQLKLANFQPSDYATKQALADEALAIREAMIPLTRELHSHENMAVLDMLTAEQLALLEGLQQFEDSTKYDIQTIRESVEPVISQAHWHHNLTLLNSLTSAKVAKWDKISDVKTELQQFQDSTQYDQQNQNDAILNLENRITILESKITSENNAVTLFSASSGVFEQYDNSLVFMVNNGTYPFMRFVEQYPDFCSENTDFSLNYSSSVFNWGVTVLCASCSLVNISPNSKVLLEYLAGANSNSELCFVSPDGRSENTPIADFIFEKIKNNDCRKISFEWLYSVNYITTLISCSGIPAGEYYLAWTGVSDNTHPLIKKIQVLLVCQ